MTVRPLSEMKPGEAGKISRVGGSGQIHRRILDMGVIPRTTITVERVAPMGDPIWIKLKGYQLSLRGEEAANIYVEVEVV
jgi:Fe2+ transport system protein FeoA